MSDERMTQAELMPYVEKWKKGDPNSGEIVLSEISSFVYGRCHKLLITNENGKYSEEDVEDLAQNVLIKINKSIKTQNPEKSFYGWVSSIVHSAFCDFIEKEKKERDNRLDITAISEDYTQDDLMEDIADSESNIPENLVLNDELRRKILEVFDELSEKQRAAVMFRYVDGLSFNEIAEAEGVSSGVIRTRVQDAKKKIMAKIQKMQDEDDYKFFAFAPFGLFIRALRMDMLEISAPAAFAAKAAAIAGSGSAAGAAGASYGAAGSAVKTAGTAAAGAAKTAVSTKLIAVIAAAAVAASGGAIAVRSKNAAPQAESQPVSYDIEYVENNVLTDDQYIAAADSYLLTQDFDSAADVLAIAAEHSDNSYFVKKLGEIQTADIITDSQGFMCYFKGSPSSYFLGAKENIQYRSYYDENRRLQKCEYYSPDGTLLQSYLISWDGRTAIAELEYFVNKKGYDITAVSTYTLPAAAANPEDWDFRFLATSDPAEALMLPVFTCKNFDESNHLTEETIYIAYEGYDYPFLVIEYSYDESGVQNDRIIYEYGLDHN